MTAEQIMKDQIDRASKDMEKRFINKINAQNVCIIFKNEFSMNPEERATEILNEAYGV